VVYGFAKCEWTNQSAVTFEGHEVFMNYKSDLMSVEELSQEIESGSYVYDFSCELPCSLPASYEGTLGYIRYGVKVVFKFDDCAEKVSKLQYAVAL